VRISSRQKASLDFAWKVGTILLLLLNLFLKTQFVSQVNYDKEKQDRDAEYKQDKADQKAADSLMQSAITELKTLVATMEVKNEINQRQDIILQDHESRIRAMENGKKR
jgi:hypothetical protein